jgi:rhodanese-related sulfurtransferase
MNKIDIQKLLQEANDCVPRLSFEEANNIISNRRTLIVDVRESSEIETSGLIENAVNIPKSIIDHLNNNEDVTILVYCAVGIRSALVGHFLLNQGYQNVFNLGGYSEWIENNK